MSERDRAVETNIETHNALQLVVDNLNHGQKQKLFNIPEVRELMEKYKVEIGETKDK